MEYPEGLSSVRLFFAVSGPTGLYLVVGSVMGAWGRVGRKNVFSFAMTELPRNFSVVREMFMILKKKFAKILRKIRKFC
jgi:hypothetical protein